jgi:DNA-binding transcriptional LysR family regulator
MDLNHVSVFVRVVELASFTAAAEQLGLPKSSVSRTVTRLEESLGVRLLQRTTRKLHLTDAGHAYYDRARLALSGLEEAASAATNMSTEPRGIVRVTAPNDLGRMKLADLLARFSKKYPLVHVELLLTSRFVDLVAEGVDLALRAASKLTDSTLIARKIGGDSLGVFASPAYLRRRGRPKAFGELAQHDCVLFRGKQGRAEWRLSGPMGEESVTVRGPLSVDEMGFAVQAVAAGLGIGLLPNAATRITFERGRPAPVRLLPEYSGGSGGLYVVTPSARFQPASVTALRDFLIDELSKLWQSC